MDVEEPAAGPTSAAPAVSLGALPTPLTLMAQANSSRKAAKARSSGPPGNLRTSEDEVNVNPFLAASQ